MEDEALDLAPKLGRCSSQSCLLRPWGDIEVHLESGLHPR